MDPIKQDSDNGEGDAPKRGRGCGCWILLLLVLLGGGAATGGLMGMLVLRGEEPLPLEPEIADLALRTLAIPGEYADMRRPAQFSQGPELDRNIAAGKEIFETQCAFCHGQNGKGDAVLGKTMYPRAAILTEQRTQSKSDGQLFWIIAHGVNLSGMPGFGEDYPDGYNSDNEIWSMVAYIRTLR